MANLKTVSFTLNLDKEADRQVSDELSSWLMMNPGTTLSQAMRCLMYEAWNIDPETGAKTDD